MGKSTTSYRTSVHLDAGPILRQFDLLGMSHLDVRRVYGAGAEQFIVRARRNGWVSRDVADKYVIILFNLTLWDL